MKKLYTLILIFALLFSDNSLNFCYAQWTSVGPDGVTQLRCIGGDEVKVFVGTKNGIYSSIDAGENWVFSGLSDKVISTIEKINGNIYLGVNGGVYYSTDNGLTWLNKSSGLPSAGSITSIAAIGSDLFVGVNNESGQGVFRSSNNGDTWVAANTGISNRQVNHLAVIGNTLFAGSASNGIYRSDDLGLTWTPTAFPSTNLYSLAVSGTTLFAGTSARVWRSMDMGTTFAQVSPSGYFTGISIVGSNIYAGKFGVAPGGVLLSFDNGTTWNDISSDLNSRSLFDIFAVGNTIYAGHSNGISRSTNNGANWVEKNSGLRRLNIASLISSGTNRYANGYNPLYGSVHYSSDEGASWQLFTIEDKKVIKVVKIGVTSLIAGTANTSGISTGDYISFDNGDTWISTPSNITNTNAFYAVGAIGTTLFSTQPGGDFGVATRSIDNGVTWQIIPEFTGNGVWSWKTQGSHYFAATTAGGGLYRSVDNGQTWTLSGFQGTWFSDFTYTTHGSDIFLGLDGSYSSKGLFISNDNGASWSTLINGMEVHKILSDGTNLFAHAKVGTSVSIYRSLDNGTIWTNIGSTLDGPNLVSFNIGNAQLFIGKSSGGIYCSTNNGTSWFFINNGFGNESLPVTYYDILVDNNSILIGSFAHSVWQRSITSLAPPAQPSAIFGSATPCIGGVYTYTVNNVPGVTYTWQFPAGWVINSGETTNSVEVTVGATPGIALVTPTNDFGSGPIQYFFVNPTTNPPAQPSVINGPVNPESGTNQSYSVVNDPGVSYTWTFPSGWVQTGGGTTNSVTVTVGTLSGTIQVTPSTLCGEGTPRTLEVVPSITALPLNIKIVLEGAFFSADDPLMTNNLNNLLPVNQPYNTAPWNYNGTENVASIPNSNIVDWVLLDYRDATNAASATLLTRIGLQAAFLRTDGSIVDLDGTSLLPFNYTLNNQLFIVIWHRNHLGIISSGPVAISGGTYTWDFTNGVSQAYGSDAQVELSTGIWGMKTGDANGDGVIDESDKIIWSTQAGKEGYFQSDFGMNKQVNNIDKNDKLILHQGDQTQVPD
jgi:hypothetical protein